MALTRAKISNIDTSIEFFVDPIIGLNTKSTLANVDVGFVFNRDMGISSNVALFWQEYNKTFVLGYTPDSGLINSNVTVSSYANITVGNVYAAGYYYANGMPFVGSGGGGGGGTAYDQSLNTTDNVNFNSVTTSNVVVTGNITAQYLYGNGFFLTGVVTSGGGGGTNYSNANVAAYLVQNTGNVSAGYFLGSKIVSQSGNLVLTGNLDVTGAIVGGGVRSTTGNVAPSNPTVGDIWYYAADDIIYRYTDSGTSQFWLDISGPSAPTTGSGGGFTDRILAGASNVTVTDDHVNVSIISSTVVSVDTQGVTVTGNVQATNFTSYQSFGTKPSDLYDISGSYIHASTGLNIGGSGGGKLIFGDGFNGTTINANPSLFKIYLANDQDYGQVFYADTNGVVIGTGSGGAGHEKLIVRGNALIDQALFVGITSMSNVAALSLSGVAGLFVHNEDTFAQLAVVNQSSGANVSADLTAYADNGDINSGWIDMGITSSTFVNQQGAYGITGPNDGYVFMSAPAGSGNGGNLFISTDSTGVYNDIVFSTGGFNTGQEQARFKSGVGLELIQGTPSTNTTSGALTVVGGVGIGGNLNVQGDVSIIGNLHLLGNAITFNTNNLTITDSILYLADNNLGDIIDIGFVGSYNTGGYVHTGLIRDASDGVWKLFSNVIPEPSTTVDFTNATYSNLRLGNLEAVSVQATGNISAAYLYGNGSQLTGINVNSNKILSGASNVTVDTHYVNVSANGDTVISTASGNVNVYGNLWVSANGYVNGSEIITNATFGNILSNALSTITHLPSYITNNANLVPEAGTTVSYGTYNFGNLDSISIYGDYDTVANVGFYSVNDAPGAPAHVEYIGWTGITKFNRVPLHVNYTQASGHTIDIDLYNYQTTSWDTFATYSGSPGWQTFAIGLIDDIPYIQSGTGNVALRLYHVNSGNTSHRTWIDYVAIESSTQGGQGPRGATGSTGATGATGATGNGVAAGGTTGQVLIKNSSTDYDTGWTTLSKLSANGSNVTVSSAYVNVAVNSNAVASFSSNLADLSFINGLGETLHAKIGVGFQHMSFTVPGDTTFTTTLGSAYSYGLMINPSAALAVGELGGSVSVTGGDGYDYANVLSTSGAGGVSISGGRSGAGSGGSVSIVSGTSGAGQSGNIDITAGYSWANGSPGTVSIYGGSRYTPDAVGIASDVNIFGGDTGDSNETLPNWTSGNVNIKGYSINLTGNVLTTQLNARQINATGNVLAVNFVGSGSLLTALPGYAYSNVNVAAYTQSMGYTNYSNANVASYLPTYSGSFANLTATGTLRTFANSIALGFSAGLSSQGAHAVAIGESAGSATQAIGATAIGYNAGRISQNDHAVAIGSQAGETNQGSDGVAVGDGAGWQSQGAGAIAIGRNAGTINQVTNATAIGYFAGFTGQNSSAIAIGENTGYDTQGSTAIAIGVSAGYSNQGSDGIAIGQQAGSDHQSSLSIAIGYSAGQLSQATNAVAIGDAAGYDSQAAESVAIGYNAGQNSQGIHSVAIGSQSGTTSQGDATVAVGYYAGQSHQGTNSVAIGVNAGTTYQGQQAVAVGVQAGYEHQGLSAVALGIQAGFTYQGTDAVAIGDNAGYDTQGLEAVAIGLQAGQGTQGWRAVAVGTTAGYDSQSNTAVSLGYQAGYQTQGVSSVAIGYQAGRNYQGHNAIAIGAGAGYSNQSANSIIINAGISNLDSTNEGLYISPVRNDTGNVTNVVYYNTVTKEMTYGPATGGGGSSNFSNVNVAAYTQTMGYTNYSNVNVAAYISTFGSSGYGNIEVAAYLTVYGGNIQAGNVQTTTATIQSTTNATSSTVGGALTVAGGGAIAQDLYVGGTLYAGNLQALSTVILTVQSSLLYLQGNVTYPYIYDIGFYSHYRGGPANAYVHTGLIRNDVDYKWYLFSNVPEPSGSTVNIGSANVLWDTLVLANVEIKNPGPTAIVNSGTAGTGNIGASGAEFNYGYFTNLTGTVQTASQPNITSVGTLTGLTSSGFINTSGNVSAAQFVGSGSLLTALPGYAYSNVNVAAYTQTMGYQNFSNVNVAAYVTSMGHTNYSNVNVIAYLAGGITSTGFINTSGNVSAAVHSGGAVTVTGTINTAGNILASTANIGQIGVSTNVTAGGNINATAANIAGTTTTANVYGVSTVHFANTGTTTSKVYMQYNATVNSLDFIFG